MQRLTYELTRKDTKMMQGLAVLAMVCLHLFDTLNFETSKLLCCMDEL